MQLQVEDVNSILKPEIEETLLHAAASLGSILCAKLLLEVRPSARLLISNTNSGPSQRSFKTGQLFRREPGRMCGTWMGITLPCMLPPLPRPMQHKWLLISSVRSSLQHNARLKTCKNLKTKQLLYGEAYQRSQTSLFSTIFENEDKHISKTEIQTI